MAYFYVLYAFEKQKNAAPQNEVRRQKTDSENQNSIFFAM